MGRYACFYFLWILLAFLVIIAFSQDSSLPEVEESPTWISISKLSNDTRKSNHHHHQHQHHHHQHHSKHHHSKHHHQHHYRDENNHKVRHHRELRQRRQISNKHEPKFDHSEYQTVVAENAPVHSSILQVQAIDNDLDANGLIKYSVSDPEHFSIDDGGIIYNIKPLDFEHTGGEYVLSVYAEDQGATRSQRKKTEVKAYIRVKDTPEPPVFDSQNYTFSISEFATNGSYVGTVVARDADNDFDRYELADTREFRVDGSGIIRVLNPNVVNQEVLKFFAVAFDQKGQSSRVPVTVNIIDENTHKPVFKSCTPAQQMTENKTAGSEVITVEATDLDRGENGRVTYSLLNDYKSFEIKTVNGKGEIKTKRPLDREGGDKDFYLTVIAKDSAPTNPLQEACSFQLNVQDVNDNPPTFDQRMYEQNIATDHALNSPVLRVMAFDLDVSINAAIEYTLEAANPGSDDLSYFRVNGSNGFIQLVKNLDSSMANTRSFQLTAKAKDKGVMPLNSTASVTIKVVSSGNLPPSIVSIDVVSKLKENSPVGATVATVCAKSNIDGSADVHFNLLSGSTEDTNADGTFAIDRGASNTCSSGTEGAVIKLAVGSLDYEELTVYKLKLQISNEANARFDEQITVNIEDVNDNPPVPQQSEFSVIENSAATLIATIKARDKDVSLQFRNLKYYFDNSASPIVRDKFTLSENGELRTIDSLDREAIKNFRIPIRITDGVFDTTHDYFVTVLDVNDVAPKFDNGASIFNVAISEETEVDRTTGIKLVVIDPDVVNRFEYQKVQGDPDDKFRVDSVTGDVLVNKALDYDHPVNDRNFTMKIRLSDGANAPVDTTITIKVLNANDQKPNFEQSIYHYNVTENQQCDVEFGRVSATDPDLLPNVDQNIAYYLVQDNKNITIGLRDGKLKTLGCLDREAVSTGKITIKLRAIDEGGNGKDADPASLEVIILDLNDNHPYIQSPENSYAIIMENTAVSAVKIPIQLNDRDSPVNGCPCTLSLDSSASSDIRSKFNVSVIDPTTSLYELRPTQELDREKQKFYHIPLRTIDKGNVNGIRVLTIEVGDKNDNPMTDGSSTIDVFNYQGKFPDVVIGSVYVTDLDDYDVGDKNFEMDPATAAEVKQRFVVDYDNGNITMKEGTPEGEYLLRVKVQDKFRNETAIGQVTVNVVDLTEEAVMNSGSFRVSGYTAQDLITPKVRSSLSMYDLLKEEISKIHGINPRDVFIFSLKDVEGGGGVDLRYNCRSPDFFTAPRLDGLMLLRREQIMQSLSIDIPMVDLNLCLYENLSPCNESCQQSLKANLTHPMLLSSKTSTVFAVYINAKYVCSCGSLTPLPSVCNDGFCYNGGTCKVVNNTAVCACRDEKEYGPRCELLTARFERGYSWYEPFAVCENPNIFIAFESKDSNGILMYSGPVVSSPWASYPKDFIYIVINQLVLETYLDFGTGTLKVKIPLEKVNQPYNYSIKWNDKAINFEVPNCLGNSSANSAQCKVSLQLSGVRVPSHLLNIQGPLQLGGMAPMESLSKLATSYGWSLTPPTIEHFFGCILELRHNDFLYDLNSTDYGEETFLPCSAPIAVKIALGSTSIIIIVFSILALLLLVLLILCLARRRQKSISNPELDGIVKETIGGTDLDGYGEKDVQHFDLNLLRVGPNGQLIFDNAAGRSYYNDGLADNDSLVEIRDDNRTLPNVVQDTRQTREPRVQLHSGIGNFITDNVKKVDNDPTDVDNLRNYCFEGDEMSIASLSSIGSGASSDSDSIFDRSDNYGPKFDKLSNMYKRDSDEEDDSEYDFKIPRQPKRYSLQNSPEKSSSGRQSPGRALQSPTGAFGDADPYGSRESLLPKETGRQQEAINRMTNVPVAEAPESWC